MLNEDYSSQDVILNLAEGNTSRYARDGTQLTLHNTSPSFYLSDRLLLPSFLSAMNFCPRLNIADRITSRMAFNIFSTSSIFAPSLAVPPRLLRMGTGGEFSCPTRAPTRVSLRPQNGSLKYTYVRVRGSQLKRDLLGHLPGSLGRENKVLPNVDKHDAVFTRSEERSR
jgi:hypothetical protein